MGPILSATRNAAVFRTTLRFPILIKAYAVASCIWLPSARIAWSMRSICSRKKTNGDFARLESHDDVMAMGL